MIKVSDIVWLNQDKNEGDLILFDGHYTLVCYSYPCKHRVGDTINSALYCYGLNYIFRSNESECNIECINKSYSYKIIGKLINKKKSIVKCNGYYFEIDDLLLPKDILENDMIEFTCRRIDIF